MTLKGPCDFKLEDFYAAPSELFEPYYGMSKRIMFTSDTGVVSGGERGGVWPLLFTGEGGVDGDGDITRPENITAFRNFVLENTDKRGLHCLMADGVRLSDSSTLVLATIVNVNYATVMATDWTALTGLLLLWRASLWKVRKISRRSWANSCCSVSSSQRSPLSG